MHAGLAVSRLFLTNQIMTGGGRRGFRPGRKARERRWGKGRPGEGREF